MFYSRPPLAHHNRNLRQTAAYRIDPPRSPPFRLLDQAATMPGEENKEFDDELVDYEEEEETTTDASKAAAEGKDAKK